MFPSPEHLRGYLDYVRRGFQGSDDSEDSMIRAAPRLATFAREILGRGPWFCEMMRIQNVDFYEERVAHAIDTGFRSTFRRHLDFASQTEYSQSFEAHEILRAQVILQRAFIPSTYSFRDHPSVIDIIRFMRSHQELLKCHPSVVYNFDAGGPKPLSHMARWKKTGRLFVKALTSHPALRRTAFGPMCFVGNLYHFLIRYNVRVTQQGGQVHGDLKLGQTVKPESEKPYSAIALPKITLPSADSVIFSAATAEFSDVFKAILNFELTNDDSRLKKNLANKIFGYLARCEFWLKLRW